MDPKLNSNIPDIEHILKTLSALYPHIFVSDAVLFKITLYCCRIIKQLYHVCGHGCALINCNLRRKNTVVV